VTLSACILGCAGTELSREEQAFFRDVQPWGFILFGRNVETPDQVRALVEAMRTCAGRDDAPVLIDQEGGRVQRLKPPNWAAYPPATVYRALPGALSAEMARLGARLIAHDLAALGITVDCLPVLDVPIEGADSVIGDRAYASAVETIVALGGAAADGLMEGGVLPVMKHMPGHGRAKADSHHALPVVDARRDTLEARDFATFRALSDLPMGMSAHVVYTAIDANRPATTSPVVIGDVIRGRSIGFEGLLMTDDLSMNALSGGLGERAAAAIAAGCDIALHCNGHMDEMKAVAAACGPLSGASEQRAQAALARRAAPKPFDAEAGRARLDAALAGRWPA
jgi:beta-N-acetylhexosaminidase